MFTRIRKFIIGKRYDKMVNGLEDVYVGLFKGYADIFRKEEVKTAVVGAIDSCQPKIEEATELYNKVAEFMGSITPQQKDSLTMLGLVLKHELKELASTIETKCETVKEVFDSEEDE